MLCLIDKELKRNCVMASFNTETLRRVVSLSKLNLDDVTLSDINVKKVKYDGVTYKEGTIPLKVSADNAIYLKSIIHLEHLLQMIWAQTHIQIGTKNGKPVLFVYED